jgi:hypothetical protein
MSPIIFNIAAKVLATLMRKVVKQGKINGFFTHLLEE